MIPIAPFLTLIYLFLYTYIDKLNLLRRRVVKNSLDFTVSEEMIGLLEICNILYAFGSFFFYFMLMQRVQTQQIIQLLLGLLYASLPTDKIAD